MIEKSVLKRGFALLFHTLLQGSPVLIRMIGVPMGPNMIQNASSMEVSKNKVFYLMQENDLTVEYQRDFCSFTLFNFMHKLLFALST